ncbi:MAG TPA: C40 family peptidase [Gaiellaceae bacterium]|nr:C40 family peptidase [Gaiellaceae bacterium]
MARRFVGVVAVLVALAHVGAANAKTLGLAEVRDSSGTLLAEAGNGAFAYPADGSVLRIGSARASAGRVVLNDVSMFSGRVHVSRIVVPSHGLAGASVDGLVVDGRAYVVGPNALIRLQGGSYIVALQEAVSPGRNGSGLVALRAFVADPSLGLAPGTQILVGLARAARPTGGNQAADVLGLPQLPAAQASLAGVPSTSFNPAALPAILPAVSGSGIGALAVALAERFLGVPYVWGGATPAGFDCSGLVMYVYGLLGIQLPHYSGYQWYSGRRIPADQLRPGDIVFFHPSPNGPQHEGMYIGAGEFVQAPHTGTVVQVSSLYEPQYALTYVGAVRPYSSPATSSASNSKPKSSAQSVLPTWLPASP